MLNPETISVLAKRLLDGTCAEDVVEWAGGQLAAGKDTPNLRMLAAFGPPFYWSVVEDALGLALSELGVTVPPPTEILLQYARIVSQQLLDDKIDAAQAIQITYRVWISLDYPSTLAVWDNLDDAWYDVTAGSEPHSYPSATLTNFADIVKQEARTFLAQTADVPAC